MIDSIAFDELSGVVKQMGFYYLFGLGIVLSGLIPGFQRTADSGNKFADSVALFRRQKFGWGADEKYPEAETKGSLLQTVQWLVYVAAGAFGMWFLMNRLHDPILNLGAGALFFLLAFNVRRNFRKRWSGNMLEFDFGSIAMGLLFLLPRL